MLVNRGNMVDEFRMHIMQTKEFVLFFFLYMRINNVYNVIVVNNKTNVTCVFKFVIEVILPFY